MRERVKIFRKIVQQILLITFNLNAMLECARKTNWIVCVWHFNMNYTCCIFCHTNKMGTCCCCALMFPFFKLKNFFAVLFVFIGVNVSEPLAIITFLCTFFQNWAIILRPKWEKKLQFGWTFWFYTYPFFMASFNCSTAIAMYILLAQTHS